MKKVLLPRGLTVEISDHFLWFFLHLADVITNYCRSKFVPSFPILGDELRENM